MLVFGEQVIGTPQELDEISRWKFQRWRLCQMFPAFKPSDFDAMGDAPWWLELFDVKRYEYQDCISILNAQNGAKRKPIK